MATKNDVQLDLNTFKNIYSETSTTAGTAITIQNKGPGVVLVQKVLSQPLDNDWNGFFLSPYAIMNIGTGELGLWVKGNGTLAIDIPA